MKKIKLPKFWIVVPGFINFWTVNAIPTIQGPYVSIRLYGDWT